MLPNPDNDTLTCPHCAAWLEVKDVVAAFNDALALHPTLTCAECGQPFEVTGEMAICALHEMAICALHEMAGIPLVVADNATPVSVGPPFYAGIGCLQEAFEGTDDAALAEDIADGADTGFVDLVLAVAPRLGVAERIVAELTGTTNMIEHTSFFPWAPTRTLKTPACPCCLKKVRGMAEGGPPRPRYLECDRCGFWFVVEVKGDRFVCRRDESIDDTPEVAGTM
jgi:hypothetical protein